MKGPLNTEGQHEEGEGKERPEVRESLKRVDSELRKRFGRVGLKALCHFYPIAILPRL